LDTHAQLAKSDGKANYPTPEFGQMDYAARRLIEMCAASCVDFRLNGQVGTITDRMAGFAA